MLYFNFYNKKTRKRKEEIGWPPNHYVEGPEVFIPINLANWLDSRDIDEVKRILNESLAVQREQEEN